MSLYVTRHGETTWNVAKRVCGRADVELTAKGKEQALALADEVKEISIDKILASPLKRAYETAEAVVGATNLPLAIDERLLEFDFGRYDGYPVDDPDFQYIRHQFPVKMAGGESLFQAAQRIYNLLDELKQEQETYLLVCHNAVARIIHSYFEELNNEEFFLRNLGNCELKKYDWPKE